MISPLNLKNSVTDPVRLTTLDDLVLVVERGKMFLKIVTFLSSKEFMFSGEDDC